MALICTIFVFLHLQGKAWIASPYKYTTKWYASRDLNRIREFLNKKLHSKVKAKAWVAAPNCLENSWEIDQLARRPYALHHMTESRLIICNEPFCSQPPSHRLYLQLHVQHFRQVGSWNWCFQQRAPKGVEPKWSRCSRTQQGSPVEIHWKRSVRVIQRESLIRNAVRTTG